MEGLRHSHSVILKGDHNEKLLDKARSMAAALVCQEREPARRPCGMCAGCRQIDSGTYPYWFGLTPQGAANLIRISQIRELQANLGSKAGEGQAKVAVLFDAHRMREESQNCLLKTLEEPPPDTLLLLLTGKPQELLPTVRSRCQVMDLGGGGAVPGRTELELAADVLNDIRARGYSAVFEKAVFVEESRKKALPEFLGALEYLLRGRLAGLMRGPGAPGASGADYIEALKQVWKAGYLLERNVNPLLLLENLFLKLKKLNIRMEEGD